MRMGGKLVMVALLGLSGGCFGSYSIEWKSGSGESGGVMAKLAGETAATDFHYVLTGDPQIWFPCTAQNTGCQDATGHCGSSGGADEEDDLVEAISKECVEAQGRWANDAQENSWEAVFNAMRVHSIAPRGMIVNGDMTAYGHPEQWVELNSRFGSRLYKQVPLYPGLGNHDYQNNIGHCSPANSCPDLMLRWMEDFATKKIGVVIDLDIKHKSLLSSVRTGSLSYSWDECKGDGCIHFVQLQNFPTYTANFTAWPARTWHITSSLSWLARDLKPHAGRPVIINYHDYDNYQSSAERAAFKQVLEDSKAKVLGIFFAHYHWMVGVHPGASHLCVGGHPVPLIYSGSVPGSNYVVARFSPSSGTLASLYGFNVQSPNSTRVWPIHLPANC